MNIVKYQGIFFDTSATAMIKDNSTVLLENLIANPHITFEYKPEHCIPSELFSKEYNIHILSEGNDGTNHGYKVIIPEELKRYYFGADMPHITISIGANAKPINTALIKFDVNKEFVVKGKIGYCLYNDTVVTQK